jgi:hypothetical protein
MTLSASDLHACCTSCRLVQPPAPSCRACASQTLVTLDRHTLRMLLGGAPRPPALNFEVLTLLAPAILGIAYTVGVLSYLLLTHDIARLPWGEFSQSFLIVGAPALACLVAFHRFSRRRAAAAQSAARGAVLRGEHAQHGAASLLEGTVQSFMSDAACLVTCLTICSVSGAILLRLRRVATFLLIQADERTRLVEGEIWCDTPAGARPRPLAEVPQVLERVGLDPAAAVLPRGATVVESSVVDGDAVTIHAASDPPAEGHPAAAQLYREGGQTCVLRGEVGRPLLIER